MNTYYVNLTPDMELASGAGGGGQVDSVFSEPFPDMFFSM